MGREWPRKLTAQPCPTDLIPKWTLIQIPEKSSLAIIFSVSRNARIEKYSHGKKGAEIKRMTNSDCLVCKLLKRISCFQTLHFSLINPIRAEHSQKVTINIKITLLNNKYTMNVDAMICWIKDNAQFPISINFRPLFYYAGFRKQTQKIRYNINLYTFPTTKIFLSVLYAAP